MDSLNIFLGNEWSKNLCSILILRYTFFHILTSDKEFKVDGIS